MANPLFTIKEKNIDPYLIWAFLTDFRGFDVPSENGQEAYPVLIKNVTENSKKPPYFDDQSKYESKFDLRESFLKKTQIISDTFSGHYPTKDKLLEVASDSDFYVELCSARYRASGDAGGSANQFADEYKLKKTVIAIIDFGCPFAHAQYRTTRNNKLSSRVRYFWDQDTLRTVEKATEFESEVIESDELGRWWYPVQKFRYGREMTAPVMERLFEKCRTASGFLDEDAVYEYAGYASVNQPAVHGAHVMDLAAGRINPRTGAEDAASEADIIFVQLPRSTVADTSGGSMGLYLHDALEYIYDKTLEAEQIVINLSFGATAGPHDGSTLIEQLMDEAIEKMRKHQWPHRPVDLVIAAGNHYLARLHASAILTKEQKTAQFLWEVLPDDSTDSFVEIWYPAAATAKLIITLKSPLGTIISSSNLGVSHASAVGNTCSTAIIRIDNSSIHADKHCALIALSATDTSSVGYLEHGLWTIDLKYEGDDFIEVNAWIERDDPLSWEPGARQGGFVASISDRELDSDDQLSDPVKRGQTGNKLANGTNTIVVGSYVAGTEYRSQSGRVEGFELSSYSAAGLRVGKAWPNFVAPTDEYAQGTGIVVAGTRTGYFFRVNGTSMAAPQVTRYLVAKQDANFAALADNGLISNDSIHDIRGRCASRLGSS